MKLGAACNCFVFLFSLEPQQRQSKWARRTAKRRERTDQLLAKIVPPTFLGCPSLDNVELKVLDAPQVDWENHPNLDPEEGGRLKRGSHRARRKRRAIEAFLHASRAVVDDEANRLIVDAGSGAGNLAIPMAGFFGSVLAIDVNAIALHHLSLRAPRVQTLCADLAAPIELPPATAAVCSLHACGAASDLAIRLATNHRVPFIVSPCCTAKAITARVGFALNDRYRLATSFQRSAAPLDVTYPRSTWLDRFLTDETDYTLLAKTADVGLGPQTPTEQVRHQRLAKLVIELDRLAHVVEEKDYSVRLLRIMDHGGYGKPEILVGVPCEDKDLLERL